MNLRPSGVLICLVALNGCFGDPLCRDMNFGSLKSADRIVLTDNNTREIDSIVQRNRIDDFVAFALSHGDGWKIGATGAPVALLRANFYEGDRFIGDFGIGSDFIAAQGCGYFAFREVSAADRARLMELFATRDPYEKQ